MQSVVWFFTLTWTTACVRVHVRARVVCTCVSAWRAAEFAGLDQGTAALLSCNERK